MIRIFFITLISLITLNISIAKPPIKFGKPSMEELEMTQYEMDTSAVAVVLCDYGRFDSRELQTQRIMRIKILKKEGLDWANQEFPGSEKTSIRGRTFNMVNGEVVEDKLKNESIFREKIYDDYYQLNIAMPNVKVGSVLDIEFTYPLIIPEWKFQQEIPVKWSEFHLESSPYIDFRKNYYGYINFYESSSNYWITKDVPAFKVEPYTNSPENYICKFEIELQSISVPGYYRSVTTTWDAVSKILGGSDYFGHHVKAANLFLNPVAREIEEKTDDPLERLKLAYEAIKEVKWNEEERLGTSTTTLSTVYRDKLGNSADINLMLVALLYKMNISTLPVVLSTRENGALPFSPTLEKLNYAICWAKIGEEEYLLDATEELLPFGMLPKRCLNNTAKIVNGEIARHLNVDPTGEDRVDAVYNLTLETNNILKGNAEFKRYEYAALDFRKDYKNYASQDDYLEDMENSYSGMRVASMEIEDLDNLANPVKDSYEISIRNAISEVGDRIYITPLLHHQLDENPFVIETREYPVDFTYKRAQTIIVNYTIPEGYTIEEVPAPARFNMPDKAASVLYSVSKMGNRVTVVYKININKITFLPNEYPILREFYNMIIKKHAEPIILKKV